MTDNAITDDKKSDGGSKKLVTLVLAGTLILALVIGGIIALVTRGGESSTGTPSAAAPTDIEWEYGRDPLGRVMQTAAGTPGVALPQQPLPDRDVNVAPAGLVLQPVGTGSAWYSTSDGPASVSSAGVPSGFAQTPQGAALAATWATSLLADWPRFVASLDAGFIVDRTPEHNLREVMVDGIAALPGLEAEGKTIAPYFGASMVRVVDWHPQLTRVEVAIGTGQTGWTVQTVDVEWTGETWAPLIQEVAPDRTVDRLPSGFTAFAVAS